MPFVLLIILAIIMWFVLHRSIYGRDPLAVGRNEEAALLRHQHAPRHREQLHHRRNADGHLGILFAFYTNSVSPSTHGNFYELYGIAAAGPGGCSLRGGEGSILGILIGTALLQVLQNLVNLLGIDSSLNYAVMGTVVLVGVLADQVLGLCAKKLLRTRAGSGNRRPRLSCHGLLPTARSVSVGNQRNHAHDRQEAQDCEGDF